MRVLQTTSFKKSFKRLHHNQAQDLQAAIRTIMEQPAVGERKVGDLAEVRVHKFRMVGQLTLLAYTFDENAEELTLVALGPHENFYRDRKRR